MKIVKNYKEFSKILLIQESWLIWIVTISFIFLAFFCILNNYLGTLPWLSTMVGFPWTAYGVSQACYYNKSKAENTQGGVKYDSIVNNNNNNTIYTSTDLSESIIDEYIDMPI